MDKSTLINYAIVFEIALVIVSLLLDYFSQSARVVETLVLDWRALLTGIVAAAVLMGVSLLLWYDRGRRLRWVYQQYMHIVETLRAVIARAVVDMNAKDIVLVSTAAGVGEELLFRGVLQAWMGIVISSLIFGAVHALTFSYFLIGVVLSMYLGWIYALTDNLLAPIVVHTLYDVYAFYVLRYIYRKQALVESR